jgi:hypothetical protein
MENLPEMDPLRIDVQGVNWREKAPRTRRGWWAGLVPAAVALVLIALAVPLYMSWPHGTQLRDDLIGVVTYRDGAVKCRASHGFSASLAAVRSYIACGYRYETGSGARLMLTLKGPTYVKVDENSRVYVCDNREITIDTGHALFDVAKDERQFRVNTPSGSITVFGTIFDVFVTSDKTVVTLKTGKVLVDNQSVSAELKPGEQIEIVPGAEHLTPHTVDVARVVQWADAFTPDQDAYNLFAKKIQPQSTAKLPAEEVFVIITTKDNVARPISSFTLTWDPDGFPSGHCSYNVDICNEKMMGLFSTRIDASVFTDKSRNKYIIDVPGEPISNAEVIHVKLVPDFSTGDVKTSFKKVWGSGI